MDGVKRIVILSNWDGTHEFRTYMKDVTTRDQNLRLKIMYSRQFDKEIFEVMRKKFPFTNEDPRHENHEVLTNVFNTDAETLTSAIQEYADDNFEAVVFYYQTGKQRQEVA